MGSTPRYDVTPGMPLGAVLAGVSAGAEPDVGLADLIAAESRQLAFQQYRVWVAIADLAGRGVPCRGAMTAQRADAAFQATVDEVSVLLRFTRRAALWEVTHAVQVIALPRVAAALAAGILDRRRAIVFGEACWDLTPEQVDQLLDATLPVAGTQTPTELLADVRRTAIALDPAWAERRYRAAVRDRRVYGRLEADGSATITGRGLPADEAAAGCARVDRLASAAQRAGAAGGKDTLRADLFLALLDGRYATLTDAAIITALVAQHPREPQPAPAPAPAGGANTGTAAAGEADADATDGGLNAGAKSPNDGIACVPGTLDPQGPDKVSDGSGEVGVGRDVPDDNANDGARADFDRYLHDADDTLAETDTHAGGGPDRDDSAEPAATPARVETRTATDGVHLRVSLTTLLGLDEQPGEIPGWGPVLASVARSLVAAQTRARWHYTVHDSAGHYLRGGLLRTRPTGSRTPSSPRQHGALVELLIPDTLLTNPAMLRDYPSWAGVLTELTRPAPPTPWQDPAARGPGRPLRRHLQLLLPTCLFPGCRHPSATAQQDHHTDWARGGPTAEDNLGPLCAQHHGNKTLRGWNLHRTNTGTYVWTSPHGARFPVTSRPIAPPLPDPIPRPTINSRDNGSSTVDDNLDDSPDTSFTPTETNADTDDDDPDPPPY